MISDTSMIVTKSYLPWAAYIALIDSLLVAMYKRLGLHPVFIREMPCQSLLKIIMRAARDQKIMTCGNFYMYAGVEAGIEGATPVAGGR